MLRVQPGLRETEHVLRLAVREAEREEIVLGDLGDPLLRRERDRVLSRLAVALDQAAADRECRVEADLLRRDRGDERLERVPDERWAKAREGSRGAGEDGIAEGGGKLGEDGEIPLRPEQMLDLGPACRLGPHASRRGLEPYLAAADYAVQGAVVPEVRPVRSERGKRSVELEAVRVR